MRTLIALAFALPLFAADPPKVGSVTPKGAPVKAALDGKVLTFTLDRGGKTAEEYEALIDAAAKGGKPPAAPAIDLTLVVTNTSDQPITLWKSGDAVTVTFALKGPGAKTIEPRVMMTREFRIPVAVEVPAGKTFELPVKALAGGMRGVSQLSYWTKPGEYELTATFKTGVSPAPAGSDVHDGFGTVTVTTAPIKVMVEEKK